MPSPYVGEYTGIIDASAVLGEGWFLSGTQASPSQIFAFKLPPSATSPPSLSGGTCPSPNATVGVAYSSSVLPQDGLAPFTFVVTAPNPLPANLGVALDASTGDIAGTPTGAISSLTVTFKITDARSDVFSLDCPLSVKIAASASVFTFLALLVLSVVII